MSPTMKCHGSLFAIALGFALALLAGSACAPGSGSGGTGAAGSTTGRGGAAGAAAGRGGSGTAGTAAAGRGGGGPAGAGGGATGNATFTVDVKLASAMNAAAPGTIGIVTWTVSAGSLTEA